MDKILYLQLEKSNMNREETKALFHLKKICEAEGFFIQNIKKNNLFSSIEEKIPRTDLKYNEEAKADSDDRFGLFCIAICDSQEAINVFRRQQIPVIAYEADESIRLDNPYILQSFLGVDISYLVKVHHRTLGLPLDVLETKRTKIREFAMDDLDALFYLYSGDHITDYIEPLYPYEEEKEYEKNYIKNVYGLYDYGMWLVIDKDTNEVIGRAGVESKTDFYEVELGYCIRRDYQHKGYATEVCEAIIAYTFDVLEKKRIYANVDEKNEYSRKLLKKLGFKENGAELFEILN